MRAENGNLNMSQRYYLVNIDYLGEGDYERCENCGNTINNVAVVRGDDGNTYRIGLDCMEALTSMLPSEKQEAQNRANRIKRFVKFLKRECKSIVVYRDICYCYKTDKDRWDTGYVYWISKNLFDDIVKKVNVDGIRIVYDE